MDASKVLHSAAVEIMMIMSHMLTLFNKQLQQKVSLHVTEKYNRNTIYLFLINGAYESILSFDYFLSILYYIYINEMMADNPVRP